MRGIFFGKQWNSTFRYISCLLVYLLATALILSPRITYAQAVAGLPEPGAMVPSSAAYEPAMIRGITVHPEDPFLFDFIVHPGDDQIEGEALEAETKQMVTYFLAALTVPEDQMWVNLSPYEKDRIVPEGLGQTVMGRDLLAQDYMLKQLTASLMYPEDELGSDFWQRVYKRARERYGTAEIPMNTFNKVWIVPDHAVIYEEGESAFVVESRLKVMLEEDYLTLEANVGSTKHGLGNVGKDDLTEISAVSSEVIKEVIIPEIEREVNEGKTFAKLRQISNAVILATWYKQNVHKSILERMYIDRNRTGGIDTEDKKINQKIYAQYMEAFEKGVYNYIKEDYDPVAREVIPRKYFAGGMEGKWSGKLRPGSRSPGRRAADETVSVRVALKDSALGRTPGVNRMIDALYVDGRGRVRIDVDAVEDPLARRFFETVNELGVRQNVFLVGEDVRDLLVGRKLNQLRYYVTSDIDADTEEQIRERLGSGFRNMGSVNGIQVSAADLSVNRIMVQFAPFQNDPVVSDRLGGLSDLMNYRARFIGKTDAQALIFRFPRLIEQMVRLDLAPDVATAQVIGAFLAWVDGPYRRTIGEERLTPDDKQVFAAADAYRELTAVQRAPENYQGAAGRLWGILGRWADAVSESYAGGEVSVEEVAGYTDQAAMNDHFRSMRETRARLNELNAQERESRNLDAAPDAQEIAERDVRVEPGDLRPGQWVISDKYGLIIVDSIESGRVNFTRVTQQDLVNSFAIDREELPGPTGTQKGSFGVGEETVLYRWTRQRGRIISVSEQAYRAAGQRAEKQFDMERLAMRIGWEVLRNRARRGGALTATYQEILDRELGVTQSLDRHVSEVERMLVAPADAERRALRRVFRAIYNTTNEDLVRTGVIGFFQESQARGLQQDVPFVGTEQHVTADVYFYLSTELLERGIGNFEETIEDMIDDDTPAYQAASETLFPRSHPLFPYDAFSNMYFAAKSDQAVMDELSRRYARALLDMAEERGIDLDEVDGIMPVPKVRGEVNQLTPLIGAMSALSGVPVNTDLVEKVDVKAKQKQVKSLVGKGMNVADAYRVVDPPGVAGLTLLLVDDHSGTGLTLDQIKKELYDAGAKRVVVLALTDSPKKVHVNLEVKVRQVSGDTGGGIVLVQEALNPAQTDEILSRVLEGVEEGLRRRVDAARVNREVLDRFFIHNLVDAWATDFSGGMVDESTARRRVLKVYENFARLIIEEQLEALQSPGSINLNTDPERTLEYLQAILDGASHDGVDLSKVAMVLSDYDNTLARSFRQLGEATASVIAQLLSKGVKFGLATQQSIDEIRQLFLEPVVAQMRIEGIGEEALENLVLFPASANVAYRARIAEGRIETQQVPGLSSILTAEHLDAMRQYDDEIQPAYVANRDDGIITYYLQNPTHRVTSTRMLETIVIEHGIPAKVVRNGYLRARVIPNGLSKTRARDFMHATFPGIADENVAVLGDNFDPEDPLSDSGMVADGSRNGAMGEKTLKTHNRELARQLRMKVSFREVLERRGIDPREGLRGFEAKIFFNEGVNIYWQRNGNQLDAQTATDLLNPDSLVYFLEDGSAILVDNSAALEAGGEYEDAREPSDLYALDGFDLDIGDAAIYDWLRAETAVRRHVQTVEISEPIARRFGISLEQLREKLLSTFQMLQVDGEPLKFINFRDVADWQAGDQIAVTAASSPVREDTKGGIDLNPNINSIETLGTGEGIRFNLNLNVPTVDGLAPEILSVRPFVWED